MTRRNLQLDDTARLLSAATSPVATGLELSERRRHLLVTLGQITNADAGHWGWGRGHAATSSIAPVSMVDFGYTPEQRSVMIEQALSEESNRTFQQRVMNDFDEHGQLVVKRQDVYPDSEWQSSELLTAHVARLGLDAWVQAVRYFNDDTWACIHLMRSVGCDVFSDREASVIGVALSSVGWFHPQIDESLPKERFVGLTSRQRTVMLMQLDGLSRKQIAASLNLSEHTVDDHLKAVFRHFDVHTAIELAALFLRNI